MEADPTPEQPRLTATRVVTARSAGDGFLSVAIVVAVALGISLGLAAGFVLDGIYPDGILAPVIGMSVGITVAGFVGLVAWGFERARKAAMRR